MSAYLSSPARPLLLVADSTEIRATDPTQLKPGQCALFTAAGANYRVLASWDASSTATDDGSSVWRPTAIGVGDPGRFVVLGTSAATPNTYALRDGSGNVPGAGGADFTQHVLHVNHGGAVPSTGLYGLSVDITAGANRPGVFYVPALSTFAFAEDTLGDDATIASYWPLRVSTLSAAVVANSAGGTASSGFVRMAQGDEIRARLGASSYRLIAGLTGPVVAVGDSGVANTTVDADSDVTITSRTAGVGVRAATAFTVKDATGVTTLIDASVSGSYARVYGRFTAYNGGTSVFDVNVASALTKASGRLQVYDQIGSVLLLDADSSTSPPQVVAYGLLNAVRAGIAATATTGFLLQNTTASTVGVPIQYAPSSVLEGRVRVSGADRAMRTRVTLKPRTSGALDEIHEYDTGSGYSEAYRFTTSTTGQFVAAFQSYAIAFSNGGVFHDGTNNGLFINGADSALHVKNRQGKGLWYSDEDLEIQTGGANARVYFDSTGDKITVSSLEVNLKQVASTPHVITFSATPQIDWDAGAVQTLTLTGNVTNLTCKNVRAGALCVLVVTQDATGGRTITFDSADFDDYLRLALELGVVASKRTTYTFVGRADASHVTPLSVRADILVP